jgi:DNA-binding XRE family transcriptional regulator
MNDGYSKWSDVRAKGRAADPRMTAEQAAGRALAKERHEAYIRGHQLAEMRQAAEITQAELAASLGVSQARSSKIEHGENSGIDVVRAYIQALGEHLDVIASIGDQTWRLA